MENAENESIGNQSLRSPPRRRRSTFFERRDSIVPQTITDNRETILKKNPDVDKRNIEMSIYCDKLLSEKDQWKKEVNERRNKYHDLRQQYQMATKGPSQTRMSYSALSNEDIEFLKAKPNLSKLVDSQQSLHNSLKKTVFLMKKAVQLEDIIFSYCEAKVNRITEQILDTSMID